MRTIQVSTEVYAAIWAARQAGEENEDHVLQRVLKAMPATERPTPDAKPSASGIFDGRSGVHFSEGLQIFRHYKGRDYRAVARSGHWYREDNGQPYRSLNRLNSSIVAGSENVWNGNWKFQDEQGQVKSINALRS